MSARNSHLMRSLKASSRTTKLWQEKWRNCQLFISQLINFHANRGLFVHWWIYYAFRGVVTFAGYRAWILLSYGISYMNLLVEYRLSNNEQGWFYRNFWQFFRLSWISDFFYVNAPGMWIEVFSTFDAFLKAMARAVNGWDLSKKRKDENLYS